MPSRESSSPPGARQSRTAAWPSPRGRGRPVGVLSDCVAARGLPASLSDRNHFRCSAATRRQCHHGTPSFTPPSGASAPSSAQCSPRPRGHHQAAGRRRSLPVRASALARAKEPIVRFPVHLCFISKFNSEQSPFLSPPCCILLSCVILPHAHPWQSTPAGQAALQHIFHRCPPGCEHASGLLLTPPCAMH